MNNNTRLLLPFALCIGLVACGPQEEKKEEEEPAVPVAATAAELGPIEAAYRGTATIQSDAQAKVTAKIGGIIESIHVEEGQKVDAGATLAQIERERLALEVDRARANYHQMQNVYQRNERVFGQKLVSREEFDRSRFELEAAKAALDLAELSLQESTITAPISGVVSGRLIKLGNTVPVGAELFEITRMDRLEAELHVPEREIHKLKPKQSVTARVDAWPEQSFPGQVARINPVVDADSGTVKVTVYFDNTEGLLRPGMFSRLQVLYDKRDNALLIPKDAVVIEDANASVFVVKDGAALRRSVELGYSNDWQYEIRSGLESGEIVVTTGRASLKDGAKVDVVNMPKNEDLATEAESDTATEAGE